MKIVKEYLEIDTKKLKASPINGQIYDDEGIDYSLIASIEENGQLEPLVVIEDEKVPGTYIIVSGHRRWKALEELGKKANCRLVFFEDENDNSEMTEAIIEYNRYRKKKYSQIVNEANLLRSIYANKAKKRQIDSLKQNAVVLNSEQRDENKKEAGRTRDKVADAVGMRPDTLEKITKIKEKADAGDEHAKLLMKKLDDEELTANGAYTYLELIEAAKSEDKVKDHALNLLDQVKREIITPYQAIKKLKKFQQKINERKVDYARKRNNDNNINYEEFYRVALADFSNSHPKLEDFMHLMIPCSEPGVLCLLTTTSFLKESLEIMDWWGFEYKSMCIWGRDIEDSASWFKGSHELLLLGTRGAWSAPDYKYTSIISEKKGHECVHDMVKKMFPGHVYIDLFPKEQHEGWDSWIVEESKEEFKETCEIKINELFIELDRDESIKMVLLSEDKQNDTQNPFGKWD